MSVSVPSEIFNKVLNGYLEDRSFIEGAEFSDSDATVFKALTAAPSSSEFPHLARWYSHAQSKAGPAAAAAKAEEDEDDDLDLFGSDSEVDEAAEALKQKRLEEYRAKKAAKGPGPIAKSSITLEVKPWDDTTDLVAMEKAVRSISMDGLIWGSGQLVPVGFGIKKLVITCVVEDDKVGSDDLEEQITSFEDYVQSVDIAAFQKI
ncbi:Translation elongation factor 1 beta [Spiromyces aspiralis]|uniref:Translation elongation factor 1 beta n=1 Tax=Spiromyces aspiralis TaxID=68401 RepID=A0ACC1HEW6_9FUNG|nr:Translation elongation factor 1 beta [Spiromyces aspiralis]